MHVTCLISDVGNAAIAEEKRLARLGQPAVADELVEGAMMRLAHQPLQRRLAGTEFVCHLGDGQFLG
ncbi:hypothetical protein D3C87_1903450 [compost metagenome]